MASAWFVDAPDGYRRGVKLFCWKKTLTEVAEQWKGRLTKSTSKAQDFATRAACIDAYERRCDELAAEGWHARYREAYGTKRPPARATEAELEALSKELAAALKAAGGVAKAERAAIARAVKRYRAARTAAGEPPDEFLVHFFAVDGVGLARKRKPALRRVRATEETAARWAAMLQKLAVGLLLVIAACKDAAPPPERSRRRLDAAVVIAPTEGPPDAPAGPPPECEVGRDACVGDDVVSCLPGGKLGRPRETCANGCKAGQCADPCETQGVELIYVVDENDQLMSFDPRKLPEDPFAVVGTLRCEPGSSPYSMAVDRRGIAWVMYETGNLYRVSILDAHCSAAVYTEPEDELYGMGFTIGPNIWSEKLLLSTDTHLSQLDVTQTPPRRKRIGAIKAGQAPEPGAELTGTADGKLFAYFPDPGRKFVRQLDPTSGKALGKRLGVAGGDGHVRAFAFAHWGGVFYVFETTDDVGSSVYAVPRKGGKTTRIRDHLSSPIVGAGVSTCAPALEAPLGAP